MQCIYNYVPETNRVSRVFNFANSSVFTVCVTRNVISPVKYVLYFYISTSSSLCAVHNMAGFCNSLVSRFRGMLLRQFMSDFEIV
jgi:hypothetical protein